MAFTVWLVSEGEHHPEECEDGDIFVLLGLIGLLDTPCLAHHLRQSCGQAAVEAEHDLDQR